MRVLAIVLLACGYLFGGTMLGTAWSKTELRVYSATDTVAIAAVIQRFEEVNPDISVAYTEFNTSELYEEVVEKAEKADTDLDVVISSAMDLQTKLVNAGLAHTFIPQHAVDLPGWAKWRNEIYGFTFEPVAMVYNKAAFVGRTLPRTRSELASMIRDDPGFFNGRLGTYDIRISGVGYLFATQDARYGYQYSRLIESFGRAHVHTFCCTSDIADAVAKGDLILGYNVIGSYALGHAKRDERLGIFLLDDYTLVMTRSAFIPKSSRNKAAAEKFVDFLLSPQGQEVITENSQLLPINFDVNRSEQMISSSINNYNASFPIKIGPNLLVYLDELKKKKFLNDWITSIQVDENSIKVYR